MEPACALQFGFTPAARRSVDVAVPERRPAVPLHDPVGPEEDPREVLRMGKQDGWP